MNEKILELFTDAFYNTPFWLRVALSNDCVEDGYDGEHIYDNDEETFDELYSTPSEAISSLHYQYSFDDDYCYEDGYGKLVSFSDDGEIKYEDLPLASVEDMAEYFYNHPTSLKEYHEFDEWYDAVEYGIGVDDEEEEEDEEE